MYRSMLEKMEEAVHRIGDGELEALVQEIQDKVRKEHVPKVLFVSDSYGRDAVLAAMEAVCGSLGIPEGYTSGNDMPFCMELGWGEEQCTATDDALGEFAYTKIKLQKKE
ncbi:MAG: hypothetical protein IJ711_10930 [Lachnospiraceae bacterium]|nr:hypothetical protein [Lachnospiraceae bacterium]